KKTSHDIEKLRSELEEVEFLLLSIQGYCERYRKQHPLTIAPASATFSHIRLTLQKLKLEYESIEEIVASNFMGPDISKRQRIRLFYDRVQLAFGGQLAASFKSLENYKSQLSINLQVLTGFNDLAVHDTMDHVSRALSSIYSVQDTPSEITRKTESSFRPVKRLSNHINKLYVRKSIKSTIFADAGGSSVSNWIEFNLESATLPLMLLRPNINEALRLLTIKQIIQASLPVKDVIWIRDELDDLLAACHTTAAATLKKPTDSINCKFPYMKRSGDKMTRLPSQNTSHLSNPSRMRESIENRFLSQESVAGNVSVRITLLRSLNNKYTKISDVLFLITPERKVHTDGLLISLSRLDALHTPNIHRSISTYPVVDIKSPVFECVRSNNIQHLRELLGNEQASPNARNLKNESLLSVAARQLNFDICELLINEGADPNNCRFDGATAIYDVRNAFWYRRTDYDVPRSTLNKILRLFIRSGCDINSAALGGNPLHFTISQALPGSKVIPATEVSFLLNMFICLGCDTEHRNGDGFTPLLFNVCNPGQQSLVIVKELLDLGADFRAKTNFGENALHLAIAYSIPGSVHGERGFHTLKERLLLLLNAGCDPYDKDQHGWSVSDFAMSSPITWFQWCLAIQKVQGLGIERLIYDEISIDKFDTVIKESEEQKNQRLDVEGTGSEWESCGDNKEDKVLSFSHSSNYCLASNHTFLSWGGAFPWSIPPICYECGLLFDLNDLNRRKQQALRVFQSLEAHVLVP
ncbi:hypothetical protein N7520_000293, partial [Penicillium odoratum]|uniref:uncharacterized protein n=1 Tax=Penicillium odoratum TaxID=1167516 RepID=UPI002549A17E